MPSKKQVSAGLQIIFAVCAGVGLCVGTANYVSQENGAEYLEEQGYTNIQGGDDLDIWNGCGNNTFSRDYNVTTPEGKDGLEKTVCFSILGKYEPIF